MPNIDKAVISVHCHNDLGLAVANSLAAVENGAGQIECTINGIGERAGNCSLEEVVMALRTRQRLLPLHDAASTRRGSCPPAGWSRTITGMHVQRNKAIVGRNAFAHEAGIHQDGMLKERTHLRDHAARGRRLSRRPTWCWASTAAGRRWPTGPRRWATTSPASSCRTVFDEFKKLADKKKEIYDGDIAALIEKRMTVDRRSVAARRLTKCTPPARATPTVSLTLRRGDEAVQQDDRPAATARSTPCSARSRRSPALPVVVRDFRVHSVTRGKDAQGESTIEVEHQGRVYRGRGVSTDTVEAATLAFLNAVNRIAQGGGQAVSGPRPDMV